MRRDELSAAGARALTGGVPPLSDLRARTLTGLKWSGTAQCAQQLLQFAISVMLARVLSPHEFGLMGMIIVFTGFANLFNEMGLGMALVQRKDLQERHLSSIFWVNVACGVALTAVFGISSNFIARFYGEPALRGLTLAFALNFLLGSLTIVQRSILVRVMDFRRLFFIETTAVACSGCVAVAAALQGFGVWSLLAQALTFTTVSAAILWGLSAWRPALRIDIGALRELFGYSGSLLGSNLLSYGYRNVDNLLVGKYLGSTSLGVYTRAYQIMLLPINQISSILTRVMFPALSILQQDVHAVKQVYMRATRTIALVTFPLMVGLLVVAKPFVFALYGAKWHEVVPIIQIFCFIGMIDSITTTTGWIYTSQGRTDIQLRWGICDFIVLTIGFVIGLPWGIIGIAVGYVLSSYALLYPSWRIAGGLINLRFSEMVSNLTSSFLCAAAMGIAVWVLARFLPPTWPPWAHLGVQVLFGGMVYLGLIHSFRLKSYLEVRELAFEQLRLNPRGALSKTST